MTPAPDIATFFLPGLVHQFGNLLLTIQGHALPLEDGVDGAIVVRARDAILGAAGRGAEALQVLRALLGEPVPVQAAPRELLRQLVEIARVPVCERGFVLELCEPLPDVVGCQPVDRFVGAAGAGLRAWVGALPVGSSGSVRVGLRQGDGGGFAVTFAFAPTAGSLPFPLPVGDVAGALRPVLRAHGVGAVPAGGAVLELRFAPEALSSGSEA